MSVQVNYLAEPPAKQLVSRARFAKLAGVSRAAVTKACRKSLSPACDGVQVDAAHPAAVCYLARVVRDAAGALTTRAEIASRPATPPTAADVDALADLVVRVLTRALQRAQAARA